MQPASIGGHKIGSRMQLQRVIWHNEGNPCTCTHNVPVLMEVELTQNTQQCIGLGHINKSNVSALVNLTIILWASFASCASWVAGEECQLRLGKSIDHRVKWELKPEPAGWSSLPCISTHNWLYCFVLWWLTAHRRCNVLYVHVQAEADSRRSGWSGQPLQDSSRSATLHRATSWDSAVLSHRAVVSEGL